MTRAMETNPGRKRWPWVAAAVLAGCAAASTARAQSPAPAPKPDAPAATAPQSPARSEAPKPPARKPNRVVPVDVEVLSEKVARYPHNPYLMNELGNSLLAIGRRPEAEEWFEKATDEDEDFAAAWNNLGVVRWALGRPSSAESAYREALSIQPNYALAWYNLGVVLDAQNKYEAAIQAYEKAFVLDPDLLDVKKNPQIVSNHRIPAVMSQTYIDRGSTVVFPTESSLSESH